METELTNLLRDTHIRPNELKLERTKSVVLDNVDVSNLKLRPTKALGVQFLRTT